jgi:hypothetical protein
VSGFVIWAVASLFSDGSWYERIFTTLVLSASAIASAGNSLQLRQWSRYWSTNWLALDETGVRGSLGGSPFEVGWRDLRAIRHISRYPDGYLFSTTHGDLSFTVLDLPTPKRIARAVSEKSGLPIH